MYSCQSLIILGVPPPTPRSLQGIRGNSGYLIQGWGSFEGSPGSDIRRHPVRLSLAGSLSSVARLRFTELGNNNADALTVNESGSTGCIPLTPCFPQFPGSRQFPITVHEDHGFPVFELIFGAMAGDCPPPQTCPRPRPKLCLTNNGKEPYLTYARVSTHLTPHKLDLKIVSVFGKVEGIACGQVQVKVKSNLITLQLPICWLLSNEMTLLTAPVRRLWAFNVTTTRASAPLSWYRTLKFTSWPSRSVSLTLYLEDHVASEACFEFCTSPSIDYFSLV